MPVVAARSRVPSWHWGLKAEEGVKSLVFILCCPAYRHHPGLVPLCLVFLSCFSSCLLRLQVNFLRLRVPHLPKRTFARLSFGAAVAKGARATRSGAGSRPSPSSSRRSLAASSGKALGLRCAHVADVLPDFALSLRLLLAGRSLSACLVGWFLFLP